MLNPQVLLDVIAENLLPIKEWLEDKSVQELMVNAGGYVFVEANGVLSAKGQLLSENSIDMALTAIAKKVNGNMNYPLVNASIEDMRFAGGRKSISPNGPFFTIRKHEDSAARPTLDDMVNKKQALTQAQADKLVDLIIRQRKNCIFAGATGSGKTTLTNAFLGQIPKHERIVTVEDSRELQIAVPNLVSLLTSPNDGITARDLVKQAMRLRPDRLILGETRGDETYDLIRAFNSGHPGSISTIHADSAEQALSALEMLFQMSLPPNAQMSTTLVRQYIASSVHLVAFADRRTVMGDDGVARVVRKVTQIIQLQGVSDDGQYLYETL